MEDTRWIRLVTIGLVLAAMAVGYFLLAQRFTNNNTKVAQNEVVSTPSPTLIPIASPSTQPTPNPSVLAVRSKGEVQTLPATGFPLALLVAFSAGAIAAGYGLRRFPK